MRRTRLIYAPVHDHLVYMGLTCSLEMLFMQVLGQVGALPDVYSELEVNFFLLRRLLGVRSKEGEKQSKVCKYQGYEGNSFSRTYR